MKTLMTLLIATTLIGCVATGETRDPPDWSDVRRPDVVVTTPMPLPQLCRLKTLTDPKTGEKFDMWPADCTKTLLGYEAVAETNTTIAAENAVALTTTEAAYDSLISAAEMQEVITRFYADELKYEKREHTIDNWINKLLLVLGLGVAL